VNPPRSYIEKAFAATAKAFSHSDIDRSVTASND